MMKVKIDTGEFVTHIKQLIEDNHEVVVPVVGWSMEPFLRNARDRVLLKKPIECPKIGDIVFYQRKNGQYVLHRIYQRQADGYYMMGDHLLDPEGPIAADAIFAIVSEVERNGRWFSAEASVWKAAYGLWRMLSPVRKFICSAKKAIHK